MSQETALQEQESQELEQPERTHSRPTYVPRCDIYETDDGLTIVADMPGVDEKSVDVSLEKGVLALSASATDEGREGYERTYYESRSGDYERSFRLSDDFDAEKIEASLKNGVLKLHLPKAAEAKPKKIAVKTG